MREYISLFSFLAFTGMIGALGMLSNYLRAKDEQRNAHKEDK